MLSRTAADNRAFVNGVLWILRSGARWHDRAEGYGKHKSVQSPSFAGYTSASGSGRVGQLRRTPEHLKELYKQRNQCLRDWF